MLNTIERRHEIVQLVCKQERVQVPELAQLFGVSTVTIRNDLNALWTIVYINIMVYIVLTCNGFYINYDIYV